MKYEGIIETKTLIFFFPSPLDILKFRLWWYFPRWLKSTLNWQFENMNNPISTTEISITQKNGDTTYFMGDFVDIRHIDLVKKSTGVRKVLND